MCNVHSTTQYRTALREDLLPPTIEHARQKVLAYRTLYQGIATPKTLTELVRLPIIEKSEIQRSILDFRDNSLTTQLIQHTTGTTANPLAIHRSQSEVSFIENFYHEVYRQRRFAATEPAPLVIAATSNSHGQGTPTFYAGPVFTFDPKGSYQDLKKLICNPASFVGCNSDEAVLTGLEQDLRIVTCRLLEMGFDFTASKIRTLLSTGNLITRRLRSWYEGTWRARLFDHYSMTEMLGAGVHCAICGFRHLEPTVIGEVVNPNTRRSVSTGVGVLLITNLYPFVQEQPFIRYWTGDLVRVGPPCVVDSLSFELEGRLSTCTLEYTDDSVDMLISGATVYDIVDDFPDVNSSRMFVDIEDISDHSALGKLKFGMELKFDNGLLAIHILLETRYLPYQHSERAQWLCKKVQEAIIERHPVLKRRLRERRVKIQCSAVPRGRVKSFLPDWVE